MPQTRSQRIHQGRASNSDWIRSDGIRRLLREADLYPYQQHHRRIWLRSGGKVCLHERGNYP